jgi:hypothetical protein
MTSSASVALSGPTSASETPITNALTVMTNAFFPQAGVGEYLQEPNERHVIVQIIDSAWAERRCANGTWVQFLIERGSLAIVPLGPVPGVRLINPCNMIVCALEEKFTREIALEIDQQPANGTAFHVRDTPMEGLVDLMISEFEAYRPCALYSDTRTCIGDAVFALW